MFTSAENRPLYPGRPRKKLHRALWRPRRVVMFRRMMVTLTLVGAMVVGSLAMPLTAQARGGHHGHHGYHGGHHGGSHVSFYYGGGYDPYYSSYYAPRYPAYYAPRSYYGYYGPTYYNPGCYGSGASFSIGF